MIRNEKLTYSNCVLRTKRLIAINCSTYMIVIIAGTVSSICDIHVTSDWCSNPSQIMDASVAWSTTEVDVVLEPRVLR